MASYNTLFLLLFVGDAACFNILAVFPHEGKSHLQVFKPVVQELVKKGHKVTALAHHSLNIKNNTYKEIRLESSFRGDHVFNLDLFEIDKRISQFVGSLELAQMGIDSCHQMFSTAAVKDFISSNSKEKYDLMITELFNNDCSLGFAYHLKISATMGISSSSLMPYYHGRFGQPECLSYIPNDELWFGKEMNFFERLENVIGSLFFKLLHLYIVHNSQKTTEQYFNTKMPSFNDISRNMSLVLTNSYWALKFPRPAVPGVVEIGGVHISESKKLPLNIEKFINESTHGVIYFSLGSMIKGHTFPQEKREEFLKAFARLPQRVLWKWENETMPGKPDNVMIQKWMPQFDILSHPNVKAFISHGGLLGVTEAVHCGVPMMVMPQYGDQHTNAKAVEANGGGVILYLRDATEEKVYQNLKTILDPEFREKAKALSERFRDRPMSPMDTAIYWVEYVARHKGAPHLRTAAVDMPLYQYLLLDVFAFLAAVLLVSLYVTYKISSLIFRSIFSKKKVKQS